MWGIYPVCFCGEVEMRCGFPKYSHCVHHAYTWICVATACAQNFSNMTLQILSSPNLSHRCVPRKHAISLPQRSAPLVKLLVVVLDMLLLSRSQCAQGLLHECPSIHERSGWRRIQDQGLTFPGPAPWQITSRPQRSTLHWESARLC